MSGKIQNEMFFFMFYLNLPTIIVVPCSKLFLDNSIKQKDFFPNVLYLCTPGQRGR